MKIQKDESYNFDDMVQLSELNGIVKIKCNPLAGIAYELKGFPSFLSLALEKMESEKSQKQRAEL